MEEAFEPRVLKFGLSDTTRHQFKGSLSGHRMRSGMIHEKSFFCSLDGVFVLEGGKLDAFLDGTVHALYKSISLGWYSAVVEYSIPRSVK